MSVIPASDDRPLAERLRPTTAHELLGQEQVWAENTALWRLVHSSKFSAFLLWGPPGTGKTSLARVVGATSGRQVAYLSAVLHGVKELRSEIANSESDLRLGLPSRVLFVDEIHRLTKNQQDVLLPALEEGSIKFIGATTENPSFEVNRAVLSRCLVFKLDRLSPAALEQVLTRALESPRAALLRTDLAPEVITALAQAADGDARRALNLLDAVTTAADPHSSPITTESLKAVARELNVQFDKKGDQHYDIASALIKSIRASSPDAAVYYLARMLAAGEDPKFIARRLVISASEDVGNANPTALLVATAALTAVQQIGMPEARITLAQATTYLAASPKSNRAYEAINRALEEVQTSGSLDVPLHLRNAPTALMKEMGYGKGYVYAHHDPKAAAQANDLPAALAGRRFYEPLDVGIEGQLKKNLAALRGPAQ